MTTLRIELEVRDYDLWREAFGKDQGGRAEHGMRNYRIFRPVDDAHRVMLDSEFDDAQAAEGFLEVMRTKVWPDPAKAPSKIGQPRTAIVELVESHDY
jgi:quinol monooxygenase YgiN